MNRKKAALIGFRVLAQWLLVAAAVVALVDDRHDAASIYLVLFGIVSVVHALIPIDQRRGDKHGERAARW
ncbi:hypothetical protein [Rhodococcus sp. 114MFTsu3.1]|uniref:hypothetical protein n=1 Tax=Rhodococcus sp. 114MFTsu3.1 TaxID=1172184 RepID=UPI000380CD0E|nr:hypothetical protein [Rhodococcus sp. 114MFTsu3.1]